MKHLFSARHASYGSDDRISDEGKKEMENLADSIKGIIGDQSAYIVSSIALRALDSAEILMSRLGLKEYLKLPYLWDAGDAPFEIECYTWDHDDKATKLMEIIEKEEDKADALIFVSHKDISIHIAELIMGKYGITSVDNIKLDEGHAVHINLETKTYQIIPE